MLQADGHSVDAVSSAEAGIASAKKQAPNLIVSGCAPAWDVGIGGDPSIHIAGARCADHFDHGIW